MSNEFAEPAAQFNANTENHIREGKLQAEKWEKTGLLKNYTDNYQKCAAAVILENQRLMNEIIGDCGGNSSMWKRISIPLVRRIFDPKYFIPWNLISIQPMLGPCDVLHMNINGVHTAEEAAARTLKRKTLWYPEAAQDLRCCNGLDAEAELTAIMAQELKMEFTREILTDLRNASGQKTHHQWKGHEKFVAFLGVIGKKLHKLGFSDEAHQWIVTSPEIATAILGEDKREPDWFASSLDCTMRGQYENWTIYVDPLYPCNSMLMGMKENNPFGSPYVYAPYIALSRTPTVIDPDSFCPRIGILSRYAKRLFRGYEKAYVSVKLSGFIDEEVQEHAEKFVAQQYLDTETVHKSIQEQANKGQQ